MQKKLYCKSLVIGIIVLFIGAGVISSAVDLNTDVKDEAREKYETEPLDEYTEIISLIRGEGTVNLDGKFKLDINGSIDISALTTNGFIKKHTSHVKANFFIGFYKGPMTPYNYYRVFGFAFGNIDWE